MSAAATDMSADRYVNVGDPPSKAVYLPLSQLIHHRSIDINPAAISSVLRAGRLLLHCMATPSMQSVVYPCNPEMPVERSHDGDNSALCSA
jgi:hypothetical protein